MRLGVDTVCGSGAEQKLGRGGGGHAAPGFMNFWIWDLCGGRMQESQNFEKSITRT